MSYYRVEYPYLQVWRSESLNVKTTGECKRVVAKYFTLYETRNGLCRRILRNEKRI